MAETTSPAAANSWDKIRNWPTAHPYLTLTLVVIAALAPFLGKPFNIDDPLFIWVAHQIQAHPANPYGFDVNWYAAMSPMWMQTENPPLASYYLALAAAIFGWSEVALHSAFVLPALAVVLGTYRLARRCCRWPLLAACATMFTPVFWISSTTVMCDVLMLAFWVWAAVLWVEGMERENFWKLSAAGLCVALAALTKYYGICLVPLLVAFSLLEKRRFGNWAACLLLPLAVMGAYEWITRDLYGVPLLSKAVGFTASAREIVRSSRFNSGMLALIYTGGCVAVAVFFMPLLWRARALMIFAAGTVLLAAVVYFQNGMLREGVPLEGAARLFSEAQTVFWAIGGVAVLALAGADFWRRRDATSALLVLWALGTFAFAAFFNWTVNGRSLLPMAPAVGILIARRLDEKISPAREMWTRGMVICLGAGAVLAFFVTRSDFLLARAARESARETVAKYGPGRSPQTFWYEGHWGFQYYMDLMGASALDMTRPVLKVGNIVIVPLHNCYIFEPKPEAADMREVIKVQGPSWLTTWSTDIGAGFYSFPGPMPFAFGRVPSEDVVVYVWKTASPPLTQQAVAN